MKLLIDSGVDVNRIDPYGGHFWNTPLIMKHQMTLGDVTQERGNPNLGNRKLYLLLLSIGILGLQICCLSTELITYVNNRGRLYPRRGTYFIFLINSVNSNNRKQQPAENNQYDMDDLIEHGADLSVLIVTTETCHIAAQDGSFRVVEVLIRGADVNVNDENDTALILH